MIDSIEEKLRSSCPECGEDKFPLEEVLKKANFDRKGFCIELGVAGGTTINMIARYMPDNHNIWGFDSFEGLPEAWDDGGCQFPKGAFSTGGQLPIVQPNVKLVKGWFDQTLSLFRDNVLKENQIALHAHRL